MIDKLSKISTKNTTEELLDFFFNGLIKEPLNKGNWTFEPTVISYEGKTVAFFKDVNIVVEDKVKTLLFLDLNFNKTGAYHNGFNYHDLERKIPANIDFYPYYNSPIHKDLGNIAVVNTWMIKEFSDRNESFFNSLALLKHSASNTRISNFYIPSITRIGFPNFYPDQNYEVVINFMDRGKLYKGWSYAGFTLCPFRFTFGELNTNKDVLELSCFTEEEREAIRFKEWRNTYGKPLASNSSIRFRHTLKDAKAIYEDYPQRNVLETHVTEFLRKEEKERVDYLEEHLVSLRKSLYSKIEIFRGTFRFSGNYHSVLNYNILATNGTMVKTSGGVSVSVEDAKKLLKIFKLHKDKPYTNLQSYNISVGQGFRLLEIKDTEYEHCIGENQFEKKTSPTMAVGCNRIPYFEVEEFLNFYKLNW